MALLCHHAYDDTVLPSSVERNRQLFSCSTNLLGVDFVDCLLVPIFGFVWEIGRAHV